jgi:hypothetical protein
LAKRILFPGLFLCSYNSLQYSTSKEEKRKKKKEKRKMKKPASMPWVIITVEVDINDKYSE